LVNERKGFRVSIDFSTRQADGITIVDLKGRITLGEGSVTLRDTAASLSDVSQSPMETSPWMEV